MMRSEDEARRNPSPVRGTVRFEDEEENEEGKENKETRAIEHELLKTRTILITGSIDDKVTAAVTAKLLILEQRDPEAPITVFLNSPGGSADSGFAIYDMLRFVKCPIRTIVNGLCASAGIMVFLAGDEGSRFSLPGSRFLLHQPSSSSQGSASDLRITAMEIVKIRTRYNQVIAKATGKKEEEILEDVSRDFWLSPEECVEYGLVDKILVHKGEL